MQSNGKYRIVSKNYILIGSSAGKEYILDFKSNEIVAKARMATSGNWLCQDMVAAKKTSIESKAVNEYLDSC